ncbi:hypothetical protein BFW38_10100 [Terasakiispira papahanaumokuakeensis]|uniref:Uncharacterized protein n=2 Tax=Terasakiispira papahanaumokuakeensis TaxID=197479 RepID=A0A1E2VA95_9GAMM|nr:hypothetical protein BFW38_10100 [Terasakiispira papahanaumokuakeensis]
MFVFIGVATSVKASGVKVTPGKYHDDYHLKLELVSGRYALNTEYGYNEGGQFEVFVPKVNFPIAAPNCKENIIIRMPYSHDTEANKNLYDKLNASENVTVTLEINPYVSVLSVEPLELQLENCNVFFRQKNGGYFNQL